MNEQKARTVKTKNLLIAIVVALCALLVWLSVFWQPLAPRSITRVQAHGQLPLAPRPPGGDFTLQGSDGPLALRDFRGKIVLLYFGYTYCPDVCPTSLALMAQALSALSATERARVQGVFVSVDPERDTPARLAEYARFFHPSIAGATGTSAQIATVTQQYGASYQPQKSDAAGQYAVDHSSVTYVIDAQGALRASLPHATTPEQIVATVRPLLNQ